MKADGELRNVCLSISATGQTMSNNDTSIGEDMQSQDETLSAVSHYNKKRSFILILNCIVK